MKLAGYFCPSKGGIVMKRFTLDMAMLVLFLLVMGFRSLAQVWHEALGLVLLVAAVVHLFWNHRWFSSLMRGRWGRLRVAQTLLGVLLLVSATLALGTGILISNHVLKDVVIDLPLHRSIFVHQLHIASACAMLIFLGMHIGGHWAGLWQRIRKVPLLGALDVHPTMRFWLLVLIGWAGCAYSRLDHIGDRLAMVHIFSAPAARLPVVAGYVLLLCALGLYAIAFYYLQKWLARKGSRKLSANVQGGAMK